MADAKFYGMKNDYMFKAVLQKSDVVLRNLVATLLDIKESEIASCKIENPTRTAGYERGGIIACFSMRWRRRDRRC